MKFRRESPNFADKSIFGDKLAVESSIDGRP
jgi:hypothetical protein